MAVSLTLLDGIPNILQEWTNSLKQYGNFNSKLVSNYFRFSSVVIIINNYIIFGYRLINNVYFQVSKKLATENGWVTELPKILSSNNNVNADKTLKALNAIRSRLNAIVSMKPIVNKIFAKVIVINRSINIDKPSHQNLTEVSSEYVCLNFQIIGVIIVNITNCQYYKIYFKYLKGNCTGIYNNFQFEY